MKIEIVLPFIRELYKSTLTGEMLEDFEEKTGSKDYETLIEINKTYSDLLKCIKNYDELGKNAYLAFNAIVPGTWRNKYLMYVEKKIVLQMYIDEDKKDEVEYLLGKLSLYEKDYPEIYQYVLNVLNNEFSRMVEDKENNLLFMSGNLSNEMIDKAIQIVPISEININLFHGTSYENYLEILKDGFIRASDYSHGSFPNQNLETLYQSENGYVFTMDSMDIPLSYSFGGYRKNLIPWAYGKDSVATYLDNIAYEKQTSVIFEIDPTNYEVYLHKKNNEFVIKGNVLLKDTKVHFFRFDMNKGCVYEITEDELLREKGET